MAKWLIIKCPHCHRRAGKLMLPSFIPSAVVKRPGRGLFQNTAAWLIDSFYRGKRTAAPTNEPKQFTCKVGDRRLVVIHGVDRQDLQLIRRHVWPAGWSRERAMKAAGITDSLARDLYKQQIELGLLLTRANYQNEFTMAGRVFWRTGVLS